MKKIIAILLLTGILCGPSISCANDFDDGVAAYEKGDYKTAHGFFLKEAEKGNLKAQYNLGLLYDNGQGVEQDYKVAIKWYKLAADKGDADAQFNLGVLYRNGEGIKQDYEKAVKWINLAADQGSPDAQIAIGNMYDDGLGVKRDHEEAVKWYKRAADQGNILAIALLISKVYIGQSKINLSDYIDTSSKIAIHVKMEERDEDQQQDQHLKLTKKAFLKWISTISETGLYEGFPKVKPVLSIGSNYVIFGDERGGLDFSVWLDKVVFFIKDKRVYIKELYLTQDIV